MVTERSDGRRALVALILLAPVPSLGVVAAMMIAPGPVGQSIFLAAKAWLAIFPAAWYLLIDRGRPSWSPPCRGGLLVGTLSGVAMAVVITASALVAVTLGFDPSALRATVHEIGLGTPTAFAVGAMAWTLANSLIEEYVYRWFVLTRCERLFGGAAAIGLSAAIFTAHHVIAVSRYLDPRLALLASAGVFGGGLVWAWLYQRYRSVWPGWLSHVAADAAVFGVGWWLLFS